MLPKEKRLFKSREIEKVVKKGKAITHQFLKIKFLPNHKNYCRFVVIIGKSLLSKATKRNRLKRVLYGQIRLLKDNHPDHQDITILVKKPIPDFKIIGQELKEIWLKKFV